MGTLLQDSPIFPGDTTCKSQTQNAAGLMAGRRICGGKGSQPVPRAQLPALAGVLPVLTLRVPGALQGPWEMKFTSS